MSVSQEKSAHGTVEKIIDSVSFTTSFILTGLRLTNDYLTG
jgi:hypothetical protein